MTVGPMLRDARWIRQSFLVRREDLDEIDRHNRIYSTVSLKFTDTTPGGNFAINPLPQFTRYADLRDRGRFAKNREVVDPRSGAGMGRYYSEAIDDNNQLIHMRFGVAQFSSMTQFWTNFYSSSAGQLARTGRATSAFYYLGRAAGFIVSVMSWKLLAFHMLGTAARFFANNNSSRFYYLKPAMPLYWNAVTTIVNHLAVNRGIIPRVQFGPNDERDKADKLSGNTEGNVTLRQELHQLLPDIFRDDGGIDIYAMANRAQRLAHRHLMAVQELTNKGSNGVQKITDLQLREKMAALMHDPVQDADRKKLRFNDPEHDGSGNASSDVLSYLGRWFQTEVSKPKQGDGGNEGPLTPETAKDGFWRFLLAELDDGSAFATFRVNYTGQVSESFTNTVGDSEIAQKFNNLSSSARSTNFSFSNGNLVAGIGEAVKGVLSAVGDFAKGALDGVGLSGLAALAGSAFVDIPKHWQSSMAQLPRASYTINLVSPYGNAFSQLINLYIPLGMLLAGVLPLSTGRQSYTSPLLLELYDQGRCQSRLAMIDSMQITRGTGNLGFTPEGHAMGIDVTFSIVDMSSIMHMPISEGFTFGVREAVGAAAGAAIGGAAAGPAGVAGGAVGGAMLGLGVQAFNNIFSDDNAFNDYMAVIAGMGLSDQIYQMRKLKINLTRTQEQWRSFESPAHLANWAGDTWLGRTASVFFQGTWRDGPQLLRPAQ